MRFDQTGELMHYIERFHADVAASYGTLAEQTKNRRCRMFLEYMSEREREAAESVHSFWHGSSDPALKEWDPVMIDDSGIRKRLADGLHPGTDVDDLLELGLEVAAWLEELFTHLEAKCGTAEQKELFASLRQRTDQEKHKLARNANLLLDF
jgi:hypothetical protein